MQKTYRFIQVIFSIIIDKKTLCLEIQNVLVNISSFAKDDADEIIQVKNNNGIDILELSLEYRPYLQEFLEDMVSKYELIIYSRFNKEYVQAIVKTIEKSKKYFAYVFHDEFCLFSNIFSSVKCINFLFGNRSVNDIIVVDTKESTLPLNPENFFSLQEYRGYEDKDVELIKLAKMLDSLLLAKDIRSDSTLNSMTN